MLHRVLSSRFLAGALVLFIVLVGSPILLRAQEVTAAPALSQSMVTPAGGELTGNTGVAAASAPAAEAGPRIAPPLERYQANLPGHDGAEKSALAASGGSHTVVLSTLALVLIVVIVVLLAVD